MSIRDGFSRPVSPGLVRLEESGLVKICGLREPDHARAAVAAGANLLGFIFAPARRRITPEHARRCIDAARTEAGEHPIIAVGIFVNATADEMNRTAEVAGLDLLQLHGDEPPELLDALSRPAMKAFRPPPGTSIDHLVSAMDPYLNRSHPTRLVHVDGFAPDAYGGHGTRADWELVANLTPRFDLMLAGGLDPNNVADAITTVHPAAVDVSSGVETDGIKDERKIAAFVAAAQAAFAQVASRA